jgi:flagellar motor protein MotB
MRIFRVGVVALIALTVASQGCIVPWSKYIKLKREYERMADELERKDSQLADDQERIASLTEELKSKDQLIKLYMDKKLDAEKIAAEAKARLEKLQGRLDEIARSSPDIDAVPGGLLIKDKLLFALGSADIGPDGQKLLQHIATQFKGTGELIQIDGHTDDHKVAKPATVEKFTDNWGLSAARALAVLRLLAKHGIAERRMFARAFSMYRPRVPNTNEANRAQNRRVEVYFVPPEFLKATPGAPAEPAKEG